MSTTIHIDGVPACFDNQYVESTATSAQKMSAGVGSPSQQQGNVVIPITVIGCLVVLSTCCTWFFILFLDAHGGNTIVPAIAYTVVGALPIMSTSEDGTTSTSSTAAGMQVTRTTPSSSSNTRTEGPVPFCQMPFTLYRTVIRDMICNYNHDHGTIPLSQQSDIQFIHIPKTGGESLEEVLEIPKNHRTWLERRSWYQNDDAELSKGLAVTIIRNPFDRIYSWFKFCLHGWHGFLPAPKQCLKAHELIHELYPTTTITTGSDKERIVQPYQKDNRKNSNNNQEHHETKRILVSLAFESWLQHLFQDRKLASSSSPSITMSTYDYLGGVTPLHLDYIIRFEHFADDYALLARALGRNESLVHKNGSYNIDGRLEGGSRAQNMTYNEEVGEILNSTPYRNIYTDAAREMVEMHFALDLITFNYTF